MVRRSGEIDYCVKALNNPREHSMHSYSPFRLVALSVAMAVSMLATASEPIATTASSKTREECAALQSSPDGNRKPACCGQCKTKSGKEGCESTDGAGNKSCTAC